MHDDLHQQHQTGDSTERQPVLSDLAERARAAESLPLADRADVFAGLHDELRTRLETGGAASA